MEYVEGNRRERRMMYDIVIRGGAIVDGTGREPYMGDVAIREGVIVALGKVDGDARQVIDANGQMVTPGFIDIHTHLDAQIGWDPDMTPVSWHGVTTALIGNCGVTFAPCKPEDRQLLAGIMESVEDIPRNAILAGLPWDWEDYGGYLNSIDKKGTAINVAGLVGHCAVRYYVMGERSFAEQATDAEKRQMADIVARSLDSGAFGFSTNRYEPHKAPDGRSIPGTFAEVSELTEIARAVGSRKGLMQAVGASGDVIEAIADESSTRVLFSYGTGPNEGDGLRSAEWVDHIAKGRDITAIAHVRSSGSLYGLRTRFPIRGDAWAKLRTVDFDERRSLINDGEFVQQLIVEASQPNSAANMNDVFFMGDGEVPNYTEKRSVKQMADDAGEHWSETLIRLSRETDGRALFNQHMFQKNMKELGDLFQSEHVYPSLGDAGAHVSQIMDAGWSTFILSYWARETGRFSMGEAIQKMTSGPARVLGLSDRGVLAVGKKADINVFDANEVAELQPELVHDFPGGAPRYIQRSKGFKATIVNGQLSLLNGEFTGTRAGQVLRHGTQAG